MESADDVVVQHYDSAAGDRPHRELFVPGRAELANDEDIERRLQRGCDLEGNGNAASRQGENEQIVPSPVVLELRGKHPPRIPAIFEQSFRHLDLSDRPLSQAAVTAWRTGHYLPYPEPRRLEPVGGCPEVSAIEPAFRGINRFETKGGTMADREEYPDERFRSDGTVEPDEEENTPAGTGRRTVDAGAEGPAGGPQVIQEP
jgi:hypothetical protein